MTVIVVALVVILALAAIVTHSRPAFECTALGTLAVATYTIPGIEGYIAPGLGWTFVGILLTIGGLFADRRGSIRTARTVGVVGLLYVVVPLTTWLWDNNVPLPGLIVVLGFALAALILVRLGRVETMFNRLQTGNRENAGASTPPT